MTIATDEELRAEYGQFASDTVPTELRRVYDLGVAHGRAGNAALIEELEIQRARIAELEKHRDALVTGAFSVQNVLTPEVLVRARDAYWAASPRLTTTAPALTALRAALLAAGFVEPEEP